MKPGGKERAPRLRREGAPHQGEGLLEGSGGKWGTGIESPDWGRFSRKPSGMRSRSSP
jgi:hypothetical protein